MKKEYSRIDLGQIQLSDLKSINEELSNINQETPQKKTLKQKASLVSKSLALILILFLLFLVSFAVDIYQQYMTLAASNELLGLSYIGIYCALFVLLIYYVIVSIKSYYELKDAFEIQRLTEQCSDNYEDTKEVALHILKHYLLSSEDETKKLAFECMYKIEKNSIQDPILEVETQIIDALDQKALTEIYSSAKSVAAFTALSPGSAFDSMVVIFNAFRLINKIFLLYGYRTNAITLIFIVRKILENASFAAMIEFADDSLTDMLGNAFAAKLSVKIAEGIGNGILVLRLGNIIIQSARPFPYDGSVGSYKQMSKLFITYIKERLLK